MAARTITRCVDLWCDVDAVIRIVQLVQQDEASRLGDLDEDTAARQVREERLETLYVSPSCMTSNILTSLESCGSEGARVTDLLQDHANRADSERNHRGQRKRG